MPYKSTFYDNTRNAFGAIALPLRESGREGFNGS